MPTLLIIDDDSAMTLALCRRFAGPRWEVFEAKSGEDGLGLAEDITPDIILLEMRLPDLSGMDVLRKLKERDCPASVVVLTGWGSITNAVDAVRCGAEQYLTKPVDLDELHAVIERILEARKLRIENLYFRQREGQPLVGTSAKMQDLRRLIGLMAQNADTTALLFGESGSGKELVARQIHRQSARRERPFLDINCAVLSETLLESEIFGHERGAFTDARDRKPGLLEVADGGTVFLDEIGELPKAVQPKLLRVLETRTFKRLGGSRDIRVNIRIIAATNQDLAVAVRDGRFREDLYYRLKVFPIDIPPLCERTDDIPELADHFVDHYNAVLKKTVKGFTSGAMAYLSRYSWPGNVRELKNVVERAMVLSNGAYLGGGLLPGEITGPRMAPRDAAGSGASGAIKRLDEMERDYITAALDSQGGNRSLTARLLGIARSTLLDKLKKYGMNEMQAEPRRRGDAEED